MPIACTFVSPSLIEVDTSQNGGQFVTRNIFYHTVADTSRL